METNAKDEIQEYSKSARIGLALGVFVFIGLIIWAFIDHKSINAEITSKDAEASSVLKLMELVNSWLGLIVFPSFITALFAGIGVTFLAHLYFKDF